MSIRRLVLISFLAAACVAQLSTAKEITVAAAADLQFAIQDVAAPIPKGNGEERETYLRFVGEFLRADSKRCAV
jgi:ABC-type molybdate transport system substrate-binding protein